MSPIKTVQPYKLYKKFADAKKSVKIGIITAIGLIIILGIIEPMAWLIAGIFIILAFPILFYNPFLKAQYEPGKSYSWVKEVAEGKRPSFIIKMLPFIGLIMGVVGDIIVECFPAFTIVCGLLFWGLSVAILKKPELFEDKGSKTRRLHHQDVDYNVKVDLNDVYGINDKMTLSYQNFHFDQKHLEKGDYLLGVSPLGVYFANKSDSVCKAFIKFEDIDTLGLLAAIGNKFIFNIKSKSNIEINIIIDEDDSSVVSPYKLFDTLLDTLDSYILNGGAAAAPAVRRRRISVSPTSSGPIQSPSDANASGAGRSIELDTATVNSTEDQNASGNRVIDISFTNTVIEELTSGEMITANRQIEI